MYSAFSERSPSAAAAATCAVTAGRSWRQSCSSSARSRAAPAGVMYLEPPGVRAAPPPAGLRLVRGLRRWPSELRWDAMSLEITETAAILVLLAPVRDRRTMVMTTRAAEDRHARHK